MRFGAALRQKYSRSAVSHRAVVDTLTDQLWASAVDAASCQLAQRLASISSLTVTEASQRISQWLSNLSRSKVGHYTVTLHGASTVKFVEQIHMKPWGLGQLPPDPPKYNNNHFNSFN